jgi:hypothetical protein
MNGGSGEAGRLSGFFISYALQHYGSNQDSYWTVVAGDICQALGRAGEECRLIQAIEEMTPVLDGMVGGRRPPHYILNLNLRPALNLSDLGNVWLRSHTPVVMLCLDHPVHLVVQVAEMMSRGGGGGRRQVGVMEEAHRRYLLSAGCPAEDVFVMAQGGPPPDSCPKPMAERRGGVVFAGTVILPGTHDQFCDELSIQDRAIRNRLGQAVEDVLSCEDDVADIVLRHLADYGLGPAHPAFVNLATAVDKRSRRIRRLAMLDSLAGLPITVYGLADAEAQRRLPGCNFAGNTDFIHLLEVFGEAAVVLNDTINLRRSSLIRLFYAMAKGCLIATQTNAFIRESFPAGDCVVPLEPGGPEMLRHCLANPAGAQAMVEATTASYTAGHQWDHRIAGLRAAIARAGGVA